MNPDELTIDSIPDLNIQGITLNKEFGRLIFNRANTALQRLQDLFKEFDALNYKTILEQEELELIDSKKGQFIDLIKKIVAFDIQNEANPGQVHESIEAEAENLARDAKTTLRTSHVFLRQEAERRNPEKQDVLEQRQASEQARAEYEALSKEYRDRIDDFRKLQRREGAAHGERGSRILGEHFAQQSNDYNKLAEGWNGQRLKFFWWLIGLACFNLILWLAIYLLNKLGQTSFQPSDLFTIEYGVIKLLVLSLLFYGLTFSGRNYRVVSHLEAVNRHRKNVAFTLFDYFSSQPEDDATRSELLKRGTEAMFKHQSIGYVDGNTSTDRDVVRDIINTVVTRDKE